MNPNLSCRVSNESPSNSASNDINIDGVCNKKFFRPTSLYRNNEIGVEVEMTLFVREK